MSSTATTKNQPEIRMYTSKVCPFCVRAEKLLTERGVTAIHKIFVDTDPEVKVRMMEETGRRTVPQIYIGSHHVGGFDDLAALDRAGGLKPLLEGQA
ncbi:MAG: glutaredoxin 3 [Limnobacter sp.]|nr:glutaredoxin 3 [Limnobacter sp.]